MTLSIRTGNGERGPFDQPGPPDGIETVVAANSKSLHDRLDAPGVPHVYDAYGPGTHSWPYWQQDLRRELPRMLATFKRRPKPPATVTYASIEPAYDVFGWHVPSPARRPSSPQLADASKTGFRLRGSGTATVTTAPLYRPRSRHRVTIKTSGGRRTTTAKADRAGRLRLAVTLGPSNAGQQFRPGTTTKVFTATVRAN